MTLYHDRLTRIEFERRYRAHPEIKKAELIAVGQRVYARFGVQEYIALQMYERRLDWFIQKVVRNPKAR